MAKVADDSYDGMPWMLTAVLVAFVVAGLAAARLVRTDGSSTQPALPDLSGAQLVEIRDARGRTVLSGDFRDRTDSLGNTEKDASLVDRRGRRVIGEVEIEIPGPSSLSPAQELEIDIIEVEPNAKFSVFIDDREITTFTSDDRGSIDLEIQATPSQAPGQQRQ